MTFSLSGRKSENVREYCMDSKEIKTKYEISKSIENTRKGFEESFEEGTLYNRQTQDKAHLERELDKLADLVYDDQCTPANPRQPRIDEIKQLLLDQY